MNYITDESGVAIKSSNPFPVAQTGYPAFDPLHVTISVGTSATAVLSADEDRTYALFQNDSDSTIYMNIAGADAVLHEGIILNAAGGFYEMILSAGNVSIKAISAISSGASKNLLVTYS